MRSALNKLCTAFLIYVFLVTLTHASFAETIGHAKGYPDGTQVSVTGCVTLLESTDCYIESTDRASGIWVQGNTAGLALGDVITAEGSLEATNGERNIQSAVLAPTGEHSAILPFTMCNGGLGGLAQAGAGSLQDYLPCVQSDGKIGYRWQSSGGAPNIGLLTKIWGTVNAVYYSPVTSAHWFYVDDGTGVVSDFGDQGIIVYSDADVQEGDSVTVTGVSSVETALGDSSRLVRAIRPRSITDVQVVKRPVASYPFSDEFEGQILDERWYTYDHTNLSVTRNPGWLTLYADRSSVGNGPPIYQQISDNWDLELKVRPCFDTTLCSSQSCLCLACSLATSSRLTLAGINRMRTPNQTTAYLAGTSVAVGSSDDYWFRVRARSGTVFASVSLDGVSFSAEQSATIPPDDQYLALRAAVVTTSGVFRPMIDYVRFTRYDQ